MKYFFLHIPKTGGKTLNKIFQDILGNAEVKSFDTAGLNLNRHTLATLQPLLISGHWFAVSHFVGVQLRKFFNYRYCFTFLRHPVDRFLSQYYFYRNNVESTSKHTVEQAKRLDLIQYVTYYRNHRSLDIQNVQVMQLAGAIDPTMPDRQLLESAKENLAM
ncbi:MAG: sulfotransferase family 2 domain-containing protein, partial [Deltaproteobacteria bacterium]|nr:sulfotransferase family 2 domain-containing protein [Deltaproteobacteria bacterium]